MSSSGELRTAATSLVRRLKPKIVHNSSRPYPWLFVYVSEEDKKLIRELWLKNDKDLNRVEAKTQLRLRSTPEKHIAEEYVIVWTEKAGILKSPFPDRHLVIIALEDLNQDNGMPENEGPLSCGESLVLPGDRDLSFNGNGGGLAFFMLLKA
ncbi:hypothetical protein ACLMJK_009517 [Lecanora helva]